MKKSCWKCEYSEWPKGISKTEALLGHEGVGRCVYPVGEIPVAYIFYRGYNPVSLYADSGYDCDTFTKRKKK